MASTSNQPAPTRSAARTTTLINTAIVAGGYLASRVLGLVRDVIISAQFGTAPEYGAFSATFGVLDLIYIVIAGGALGSAFIPVFAGFMTTNREDDAWRLASTLLRLAFAGLIVASILIGLLAEPIVGQTIGRSYPPDQQALTVWLLRLLLLQPLLLGIGGLSKATLEALDHFSLPALGSNLYNIGIIGGALLAPWLGIYGLVVGVNIGALLFVLVQLPGLRGLGARYLAAPWRATAGIGQVGRLLGPRLFGQAAWQLNQVAIITFATALGTAAVAANRYALTLMLLPHGLIALSLGTVMFPQLTRLYAAGDTNGLRSAVGTATRNVLFVSLLAAVVMAVCNVATVRLLYERGRFDDGSTVLTAQAVAVYMLGLPAFAAAEIIVRSFYAMQDTRTPVVVVIFAVLLNIGLGWLLVTNGFGLAGLALAFSIANISEAAVLLVLLNKRLGGFGAPFWRALALMHAAALATGAALLGLRSVSVGLLPAIAANNRYQWPGDFVPLLVWVLAIGVCGAAVYAALAWVLRLDELRTSTARFGALARRFRR